MTAEEMNADLAYLEEQIQHLLEKRDRLVEGLEVIQGLSASLVITAAELRALAGGDE